MSPFMARSRSSVSSILTTLDGGAASGYAGIPQVERVIAVHLCARNASTSDESHSAVPREGVLWLNLAEMKDVDKARFLDAPISQAGLFCDTVEGFTQQFSAVQQQTEAIQHILPRRDAPTTAAPGARPQSARRRGRPPELLRPQAELTPRPARRASCRRAAPPRPSQAPNRPGSRRRASGTHFLKERAISFSSGFSGPWDDSVRRSASALLPTTHFCQQPRECGSGTQYLPTHLWPVPFGTQGVRRGCLRFVNLATVLNKNLGLFWLLSTSLRICSVLATFRACL